ncbi:Hypothetical predicted protein [Cloeon dipterum]|uniref:Uncharacterized protein n=1 Tax=Cloeon dipterum TaxID=197152 RepID=A0A8S1D8M2_9INSE|nr:Hypothetical predicted protein [Cloeon dipterum]
MIKYTWTELKDWNFSSQRGRRGARRVRGWRVRSERAHASEEKRAAACRPPRNQKYAVGAVCSCSLSVHSAQAPEPDSRFFGFDSQSAFALQPREMVAESGATSIASSPG